MCLVHIAVEVCMSIYPLCVFVYLHVSLGVCVSGHLSIPLDFCICVSFPVTVVCIPLFLCVCLSLCVSTYTIVRTFGLSVLVTVSLSVCVHPSGSVSFP